MILSYVCSYVYSYVYLLAMWVNSQDVAIVLSYDHVCIQINGAAFCVCL